MGNVVDRVGTTSHPWNVREPHSFTIKALRPGCESAPWSTWQIDLCTHGRHWLAYARERADTERHEFVHRVLHIRTRDSGIRFAHFA